MTILLDLNKLLDLQTNVLTTIPQKHTHPVFSVYLFV